MKEVADKKFNPKRRVLLLGGLAASTAGVLQACGGGGSNGTGATGDTAQMAQTSTQCPSQLLATTSTGSATPLQPNPSYSVSLDSYGGVPGASASAQGGAGGGAAAAGGAGGGGARAGPPGAGGRGGGGAGAGAANA